VGGAFLARPECKDVSGERRVVQGRTEACEAFILSVAPGRNRRSMNNLAGPKDLQPTLRQRSRITPSSPDSEEHIRNPGGESA
jgi:hypothetical protein